MGLNLSFGFTGEAVSVNVHLDQTQSCRVFALWVHQAVLPSRRVTSIRPRLDPIATAAHKRTFASGSPLGRGMMQTMRTV